MYYVERKEIKFRKKGDLKMAMFQWVDICFECRECKQKCKQIIDLAKHSTFKEKDCKEYQIRNIKSE
jgi:CO dehydrogenase/acetyl-CoA synthase alpha subunit